jgi:anti-sigma factor RsiW
MVNHRDVGAYALGVLDSADAALAETHLATCEQCAVELIEFRAIAKLLQSDVRLFGAADLNGGGLNALPPRTLRRPGWERTHYRCR